MAERRYAVSWNSTNPCARLPLIMGCPTKPPDASFVLLTTTERYKPLSFPYLSLRTLVWGVIIHNGIDSQYIPIVMPVQRADMFFSHVQTLEDCLLLGHCHSL